MKKNERKKQLILITSLILITLILDQITKYIFYKNGQAIIPNEIDGSNNGYYIIMSIIVVIMIIRYISNDNSFIKTGTKIVLSFGISGAIGNVIDRIFRGYVIVFIKLGNEVYINLAYIYIVITWVGMAAILAKNSFRFLNDRKKGDKR